jgi:hypothetical protein
MLQARIAHHAVADLRPDLNRHLVDRSTAPTEPTGEVEENREKANWQGDRKMPNARSPFTVKSADLPGECDGGGGLLNADQHFGHRRFSSQILAVQSFSSIARIGCCWLRKRRFGSSPGQLWGHFRG